MLPHPPPVALPPVTPWRATHGVPCVLSALVALLITLGAADVNAEVIPRAGNDGSLLLESARHSRVSVRLEADGSYRLCDQRYRLCSNLTLDEVAYHAELSLTPDARQQRVLVWTLGPQDGRALHYEDGASCARPDACENDDALVILAIDDDGELLGGVHAPGRGAMSVKSLVTFEAEAERPAIVWIESGETCGCECEKAEWRALALLPNTQRPARRGARVSPWRLAIVHAPQLTGDVEMALDCYPGDPDTWADDEYDICIMSRRGAPEGQGDGRFSLPSRVRYSNDRALWLTLGWDARREALVVEGQEDGPAPAYSEECRHVRAPCPCGAMRAGEVVRQ